MPAVWPNPWKSLRILELNGKALSERNKLSTKELLGSWRRLEEKQRLEGRTWKKDDWSGKNIGAGKENDK